MGRRHVRIQVVTLFVCSFIVVGALVSAARAGVQFSPPQVLSQSGVESASPQVAVDSQDHAIAVWQAVSADHQQRLVQLVRLDAGGSPGSVINLVAMENFDNPNWCLCPKLVVDPQGRITATWQAFDGDALRIQAVQLEASGNPGPILTLSAADTNAGEQEVAVDSLGRATVVWQLNDPPSTIQSARLIPGRPPEAVQTLSSTGVSSDWPDVALDRSDRATVAWGSDQGVQSVRIGADGSPASVQTLSPAGEDSGLPRVAIDSQDRATIAWWRLNGADQVKALRLDADGVPGPVRTLSPPGVDVFNPQIAIDPQDRVTVTWEDFVQQVHAVRLGADGLPGVVRQLSPSGQAAGHPQVAASPDGGAVVVWNHPPVLHIPPFDECLDLEFQADSDVVRAAFIEPDGSLGPVRAVSAFGQQSMEAQVAVDSQGLLTVVWHSFDGTFFCPDLFTRIQSSSGLDILDVPADVPIERPPVSGPVLPGVTPGDATLRLAARAVVRGHQVAIRAVCVGDITVSCGGEIGLVSRAPFRKPTRRSEPRRALLSRGSYRLRGGDSRIVKLGLSRFGRKLCAQSGPMTIKAAVRGRGVESRTVSIKIPRGHSKDDRSR